LREKETENQKYPASLEMRTAQITFKGKGFKEEWQPTLVSTQKLNTIGFKRMKLLALYQVRMQIKMMRAFD
jgi:hypothetical protein